ncbi:MAG: KilA-N domain-containing protein [Campylobacterales bacterium]|nr:KilA-N domain-containing protein [Campylobacterales bacterium]
MKNSKILVKDTEVSIKQHNQVDFISLMDIARAKNPDEPKDVVKNWLRSRTTIEFLGLWEHINNPNFKGVEFDSFKNEAGANSFTMSPIINYKIHTDAIKEHLIPHVLDKPKESFVYANEADLLNIALFGVTAKEWREVNKDKEGNLCKCRATDSAFKS